MSCLRTGLVALIAAIVGLGALGVVAAPSAEAGILGRNRMHVVAKIERRLERQTRRNARGVGRWSWGGTGWLVGRSSDGAHGLVMTAYHVSPHPGVSGEIDFGSARGRVVGWLGGNEELDYALLKVDFADGGGRRIRPIQLSWRRPDAQEGLYTVGFSDPSQLPSMPEYNNFDHSVRDFDDLDPGKIKAKFGGPPKYISVGRERGGGRFEWVRHLTSVPRMSFVSDLHALPGASGSPVFSTRDHKAIGVVWGGGDSRRRSQLGWGRSDWTWRYGTYTTPTHLILADLQHRLGAGQIEADPSLVELLGRK